MPDATQRELPLFPLNVVLYPGMQLPLRVFEDRYKLMMKKCLEGDKAFGVVLIKSGREVGGSSVPYEVGTVAKILDIVPQGGGRMNLSAIGEDVFRILKIQQVTPYMVADVEVLARPDDTTGIPPELSSRVRSHFQTYISLLAALRGIYAPALELDHDPQKLSYTVASGLMTDTRKKQWLLETSSVKDRLEAELRLLQAENLSLELFLAQKKHTEAMGGKEGKDPGPPRFSPN